MYMYTINIVVCLRVSSVRLKNENECMEKFATTDRPSLRLCVADNARQN